MKTDIEQLKVKILEANKAYRTGDAVISDTEFDSLLEQYEKLVPEDEYNSFRNSLNEGAIVSEKKKIKHKYVAGSLDKLKYEEPLKVRKFIDEHLKTSLNISAKIDGLSGIVHYVNGKLVSLGTRGDGYEGEDHTEKAKCVKFLPKEISLKDDMYVRGELVILKKDFSEIEGNAARNVVSGLIGRKEWNPKDLMNVSFIAYTILGNAYEKSEQFKLLDENGFKTAWNIELSKDDIEKLECNGDGLAERLFSYASQDFEYETDGLVISDSSYKNEDKYRPEAQMAFKINQQAFETRLVDIEWNGPSKDGYIVPIGILEPVECNGVIVSRCTLHNLDFIESKGLKLGSKVKVLRSGDVIPKLLSVAENDESCTEVEFPATCPCCGTKLIQDGVNFRCINKKCEDQTVNQIANFIRKFDVESVNVKTLKKFGIHDIPSLLAFIPNEKYKLEMKLANELKTKVFTQSKEALLAAMNFHGIGETIASKIIDHFGYDAIVANPNVVKDGTLPDGIGESFIQRFLDDVVENISYVQMITNDSRYSYLEAADRNNSSIEIIGSICFTGALSISRNEASKLAKAAGFEVKGGVSKGLDYLVTNDPNSGSSKNKKAKSLGTKVIDEAEFMKLMNKNTVEEAIDSL